MSWMEPVACQDCVYGILSVAKEGKFSVPVKDRTRFQKSAVIKPWLSKQKFTVGRKKVSDIVL